MSFTGNDYGDSKIVAEELCQDAVRSGLDVVILRPSIVYGPFSGLWTIRVAERLLSGRWRDLGEAGSGTCNLVYVDDVARAVVRSLEKEGIAGEAFNINGDETVSWTEYYRLMNQALGLYPSGIETDSALRRNSFLLQPVRSIAKVILGRFRPLVMKVYARNPLAKVLLKRAELSLKTTPTPNELGLYGRRVHFANDKAKKDLGTGDTTTLSVGLDLSAAWLRHHGFMGGGREERRSRLFHANR